MLAKLLLPLIVALPGGTHARPSTPSASSHSLSRMEAARHVAEDTPRRAEAEASLLRAGRAGLWALDAMLKDETLAPEARGRLLEAASTLHAAAPDGSLWMLRRGLADDEPRARLGAVLGLSRIDDPRRGALLMAALDEPDPEVRSALADVYAQLGEDFLESLETRGADPSPNVRAAVLLASSRAGRDLRAAIEALGDTHPVVRDAALTVASERPDARLNAPLAARARLGQPEEQMRAVEALALIPGSEVELGHLVADANVPDPVALAAVQRLRDRNPHSVQVLMPQLLALPEPQRQARLAPMLSDPRPAEVDDWVRGLAHPSAKHAALSLACLDAVGALGLETAALRLDSAGPTEAAAIRRMLAERKGGVSEGLVSRSSTGPVSERAKAIAVIGLIGSTAERAQLLPMLDDEAPEIRAVTARALADVPVAEGALLEASDDADPEVRAAAIAALGDTPDAESTRLAALGDDSTRVRLAAVDSFEGTRDPKVIAALERRVISGSGSERNRALDVIARSPSEAGAEALVDLVTYYDPAVRQAALRYVDEH